MRILSFHRQVVLVAYAEVTSDRTSTHRTTIQLIKTTSTDARVSGKKEFIQNINHQNRSGDGKVKNYPKLLLRWACNSGCWKCIWKSKRFHNGRPVENIHDSPKNVQKQNSDERPLEIAGHTHRCLVPKKTFNRRRALSGRLDHLKNAPSK